MKLELYSMPNCEEAKKIRDFLEKNGLPFKETLVNSQNYNEFLKLSYWNKQLTKKVSILKITYSSSIHVITGYDEFLLKQATIEHIKKYNAHVQEWN